MIATGTKGMPAALITPRGNAEATLRAYEESKRAPFSQTKKILDRVPIDEIRASAVPNATMRLPYGMYPGNFIKDPTRAAYDVRTSPSLDKFRFVSPMSAPAPNGISALGYGTGIEDTMVPGGNLDPNVPLSYTYNNRLAAGVYPGNYMFNPTANRGLNAEGFKAPVSTTSNSPVYSSDRLLKDFRDPIADRVIQTIVPGSSIGSLVSNLPDRTVAFMSPEDIDLPPDIEPSIERTIGIPAASNIPIPRLRPEGIGTSNIPIPRLRPEGIGPSSPYEGSEPPTDEDITGQGGSPSQEDAAPSQDFTVTPEAEAAQEAARVKAERARRAGGAALNLFAPPFGTIIGQGIKFADAQMQKLVDRYQSSGIEERRALEDKYPNLIPRAQAMGIQSYYGMDKYRDWADKAGLRAPPSREGGKETSGIEAISPRPPRDGESNPRPNTSSGGRPEIYYMWDLGIKIPSPSDPNYTQYQTYLAERLAAQ
jgi:hypothetical protein